MPRLPAVQQPLLPIERIRVSEIVYRFRAEFLFDLAPGTRELYERSLLKIERRCGDRFCDARFRDVALAFLREESPAVANRANYMLGRLLRLAQRLGHRSTPHDLDGLCSIKTRSRDQILTLRQRVELLRYIDRPATARRRVCLDVIAFLLHSGWRSGEACSLRWDYLELDEGLARLPHTKTGPQTRALGDAAMAVVTRRPRLCPWVFPARRMDRGVGTHRIAATFRQACADLGISGVVVHSLRHTVCTVAAQMHLSPKFIAAMVGHSAEWQSAKYTHPSHDDVRSTASLVGVAIEHGPQAAKGGRR